jgi:hypothetical protein
MHTKAELKVELTHVFPMVSLTYWVTLRPLFAFLLSHVEFCLEDFGEASLHSDDEPCRGCALYYESSYEQNFEMQIFIKRGLCTVCF